MYIVFIENKHTSNIMKTINTFILFVIIYTYYYSKNTQVWIIYRGLDSPLHSKNFKKRRKSAKCFCRKVINNKYRNYTYSYGITMTVSKLWLNIICDKGIYGIYIRLG